MAILMDVHNEQRRCNLCSLRKGCSQVVPGVGPSTAKIVLVGEAPGADEDAEGIPFFGRCGKLLTKLLSSAMLDRNEIYITNAVGCRPPKNRPPENEEVWSCKHWLVQKLLIIQPKVVVTLGKIPTRLILDTKKTIKLGDYVGKSHRVDWLKGEVIPLWHPSYLLQHGRKYSDDTVEIFKGIKQLTQ